MFSYRFTFHGKPLTQCPGCEADLTARGEDAGVLVQIKKAGIHKSRLDADTAQLLSTGTLRDLLKSDCVELTACGKCILPLENMTGVQRIGKKQKVEQPFMYKRQIDELAIHIDGKDNLDPKLVADLTKWLTAIGVEIRDSK